MATKPTPRRHARPTRMHTLPTDTHARTPSARVHAHPTRTCTCHGPTSCPQTRRDTVSPSLPGRVRSAEHALPHVWVAAPSSQGAILSPRRPCASLALRAPYPCDRCSLQARLSSGSAPVPQPLPPAAPSPYTCLPSSQTLPPS